MVFWCFDFVWRSVTGLLKLGTPVIFYKVKITQLNQRGTKEKSSRFKKKKKKKHLDLRRKVL